MNIPFFSVNSRVSPYPPRPKKRIESARISRAILDGAVGSEPLDSQASAAPDKVSYRKQIGLATAQNLVAACQTVWV